MVGERILVIDDDANVRQLVEVNLRLEGYQVIVASNGADGLQRAFDAHPAAVVLDVLMPGIDGIAVCRRLRVDPRTSHIPVILLTVKSQTADKVVGLAAGADDYVVKPFDPMELVARVRTAIRRAAELGGQSPLTGLPGNHRIETEIARRFAAGHPIAVGYVDLSDFKSYNDHYGFLAGDTVLQATAEVLRSVLTTNDHGDCFLGHVGGDDFVMVFPADLADDVCRAAVTAFDRMIPAMYAEEDLRRGYLEVEDRRGVVRRFGMVTMIIGVTSNVRRTFDDHRQMVLVATEMKAKVKRLKGAESAYALDERTGYQGTVRTARTQQPAVTGGFRRARE